MPRFFSGLFHWIDKLGLVRTDVRVLMEGTGVYHTPAAIALTQAQIGVRMLNPARVRSYAPSMGMQPKNDQVDSIAIAQHGARQS